jgi:tripartite-type tricarboxylate transporter receptor subunit TctC
MPRMKKIIFILTLFYASVGVAFDMASKPITVIIPFAPGGGVDATVKNLTKYANKYNINLVPVYKPGADGLIGLNELSKLPKDGYNVSISTTGSLGIYQTKNNTENLVPIIGIRNTILAVVVNNNSNIKTIEDYEYAIKNNPKFSFGFGAPIQKILFKQLTELVNTNIDPILIPYKGGSQVIIDLLGGHITSAILPLNLIEKQVDSNELRILALDSEKIVPKYSKVPLLQKIYPSWQSGDWYCLILSSNVGKTEKDAWISFITKYVSDPIVLEEFRQEYSESVPTDQKSIEAVVKNFIKRNAL